jgi:hypothetical protein
MMQLFLYLPYCALCCGYSVVKGGQPERLAAMLMMMATTLSLLVQAPEALRFKSVDQGMFVVDVILFLCLVLLSIFATRFWLIWVSAMQMLSVLSHIAILMRPDIIPAAYWYAITLWSYPMLLLLALGSLCCHRRMKTKGVDICWKKLVFF